MLTSKAKADPIWPDYRNESQLSRRDMLTLFSALPAFSILPSVTKATSETPVFAALIDVFLPADETSPAGSEIGIDAAIADLSLQVPNYPQLIDLGKDWLQSQSFRKFAQNFPDLNLGAQNDIIQSAFDAPLGTLEQVFVSRIRNDAITLYYAHPSVAGSFGLAGSLQPLGYPDYNQAPKI